jgi:hypothetical protein
MSQSRGYGGNSDVLNAPEQRKRLTEIDNQYLQKLTGLNFNAMSVYGKVDYILLKSRIEDHKLTLTLEEKEYGQIEKHIPFAVKFMTSKRAGEEVQR